METKTTVISSGANKISYHGLAENAELFACGFPILAYHKIDQRPARAKWRSLYLSPRLFARQMAELAAAGFTTTSLSAPRPARGNAAKKFIISFDDGYVSVLQHAGPVLARHGFAAIQFLVSDEIGGTNSWDAAEGEVSAPLLNAEQVKAWLAAGHEIGSHTRSHPRLTRLSPERQKEELRASRIQLEDRFGTPVRHLGYPYGDFDERVAAAALAAGYQTACTMVGGVNLDSTPPFALRRLEGRYRKRSLRTVWQHLRGWLR